MTIPQKHKKADELRTLIEQKSESLAQLKVSDTVEISRMRLGYQKEVVEPWHHETDTKGVYEYTQLERRLTDDYIHNITVNYVNELIEARQAELGRLHDEYSALFSA